jgi:hypothetical protein
MPYPEGESRGRLGRGPIERYLNQLVLLARGKHSITKAMNLRYLHSTNYSGDVENAKTVRFNVLRTSNLTYHTRITPCYKLLLQCNLLLTQADELFY